MENQELLLNWSNINWKNEEGRINRQKLTEFIWDTTPNEFKKANFFIDFNRGYITFVIYKVYTRELEKMENDKRFIEIKNDEYTKSFLISFEDFLLVSSNI